MPHNTGSKRSFRGDGSTGLTSAHFVGASDLSGVTLETGGWALTVRKE